MFKTLIVAPLFSSSAANATYIGTQTAGVLIDVGCSYRALRAAMKLCDIQPTAIKAVLITHEHCDHVKGLLQFAKHNPTMPIFAPYQTRLQLIQRELILGTCTGRLHDTSRIAVPELDWVLTAFETPHDSFDSAGYTLTTGCGVKIAYFTDLGEVTKTIKAATLGVDFAIIESNYDTDLLTANPNYNYETKERIKSRLGHLSNPDSAEYICELVESGTTQIVLAHLSRENNTPKLARDTAVRRLLRAGAKHGRDYTLGVAEIQTSGEVFAVNKN